MKLLIQHLAALVGLGLTLGITRLAGSGLGRFNFLA